MKNALRQIAKLLLGFLLGLAFLAAAPLPCQAAQLEPPVISHAEGFEAKPHPDGLLVTVRDVHNRNAKPFEYLLYPRQNPRPQAPAGVMAVGVPVKRAALASTTMTPYFVMLGIEDAIVGLADGKLVNNSKMLERVLAGKVVEIGAGDGMGALNIERIAALAPELVFSYGTGVIHLDVQPKLIEAGIIVALDAGYKENTPLGRTEWIKFIALFFGQSQKARELFSQIEQSYLSLAQKAKEQKTRPTVFCNMDFEGTWYVPGKDSYMAQFLADAGARYLFDDMGGKRAFPVSTETVIMRAAGADFWLNPGTAASLDEMLAVDPRYRIFAAFKNGNIYNHDLQVNPFGGNDFWETGVANPHLVLSDLVKIFHPSLADEHSFVWYRRLPESR
ncbi:MAG: ABC transporter substrate-binding protein [Desulfatibacillaceae bacterium]|nr:ABC transporter substrate-binding protein [Desulfatibacillaceae bacterium]